MLATIIIKMYEFLFCYLMHYIIMMIMYDYK